MDGFWTWNKGEVFTVWRKYKNGDSAVLYIMIILNLIYDYYILETRRNKKKRNGFDQKYATTNYS